MSKGKRWSRTDIETVKQHLEAGKTVSWLASEFKTTIGSMKMLMSRNGLGVRVNGAGAPSSLERSAKDKDIARRLAVLQGLEPAPEVEKDFHFSDDQLRAWIGAPELFFKELLGVELYAYQKDMLGLLRGHRRVVFCCGRGVGKSYLIALWLVYKAVIRPNQKCLVIAPSDRQAKLLLEYVHGFLSSSDQLFKSVNFQKTNQERITFTNESWLAPLGSTSHIRGFQNIDLLLLDEAAYVENQAELWTSVLPMLKSGTGQFVVSSTPSVVGDRFHQSYLDPSFAKKHVPATESPRFTREELEQMQSDLSPYEYNTEVLAEFVEGSNTFFSPELLQRATQRYDFESVPTTRARVFCGIDIGRYKDASVIVFLREEAGGVLKMIYAKEVINTPLTAQVGIIKQLAELWVPVRICIEKNGLSIQTVEELTKLGLPVLPFTPTVETKQEAYTSLLKLFNQDKVVLPMVPRLQHQLRNFMYEVTSTGKLKLHHSTEIVGDDWPDALCFAAWAARKPVYRGFLAAPGFYAEYGGR